MQMKCLVKSDEELCQLASHLLTQCTEEIIGEAFNPIFTVVKSKAIFPNSTSYSFPDLNTYCVPCSELIRLTATPGWCLAPTLLPSLVEEQRAALSGSSSLAQQCRQLAPPLPPALPEPRSFNRARLYRASIAHPQLRRYGA